MGKRNPNGYGSVTKLKGNRTKPWIARVTVYSIDGSSRQVPIGYAETEEKANILLAQYNNNPWNIQREKVTLIDLYNQWAEIKLPKLGQSNQASLKTAFTHCSKYYGVKYRSIRAYQMQDTIDNCGLGYSTQGAIKNLWGHLDRFAFELDIIDKMYSQITTAPPIPESTKEIFTEDQIDSLWAICDTPWVDSVLFFIYSGFRMNELMNMRVEDIDLEKRHFKGGSKTANGKNRIVPIHPRIFDMVQHRVESSTTGYLLENKGRKVSKHVYRTAWNNVMQLIGTSRTPHEARHTFRSRLDSANGNKKCIDLLMGHKTADVGIRTYTHKTVEELEETILLLR